MREAPRSFGALESELEALRHLIHHASDLLAEIDASARFVFVSPNCEALTGIPSHAVLGSSWLDGPLAERVHPDDRAGLADAFRRVVSGEEGEGARYRFRHADGSWHWYESKGQTFHTPAGEWRAVVISRDVTESEQALREMRQSEERYRVLTETTHDIVCELDDEGRVVFISPSSAEVLGYEPRELLGTTPFSLLHPDDVEPLAARFLERVGSERERGAGAVFRVRHRDGSWRWLEGSGVNYETPAGERHVVAVMGDITERLRAAHEWKQLDDWVQRAQRFESLGLMASGIAHDFNNLLTPILGDASLALIDLVPESPLRSRLIRIQRAAHRAATLTHQLLDYAGMGSLETEPVDLSKLIHEMAELLQSAAARRARIGFDLAPDLPWVRADAAQVSQVVMNLITNAAEAIDESQPEGGRIDIRSGALDADRAALGQMLLGEELPEGAYAYLEVEDGGCGMDDATRVRVFDPFFTTKFTGRGLGLAAVLGIVRKHRGAIAVESEPGRGTRIRVLLPAMAGVPVARPPDPPSTLGWRGSGTILVADDDEGARELMSETLARAGFAVLCAGDGGEAAEVFRRHAGEIQLVVLDRTMPGASGDEALAAIRSSSPDVPVLLVSGYSRESASELLASEHVAGFLEKPFLPDDLVRRVRETLGD